MAYLSYQNKSVFYKRIGKGQPLLLLHGNTASGKMFDKMEKLFVNDFELIIPDYPGHGKSERIEVFVTDFWYQQALMCNQLLEVLDIKKAIVAGTSGGALVGLNLALEYPEKVGLLLADSFMGAQFSLAEAGFMADDRSEQKRNPDAVAFWEKQHGTDWEQVIDADTHMLLRFSRLNKSFFNKPLSQLAVPTCLTTSREDLLHAQMEALFLNLKQKNQLIRFHLFERGHHPAMLSNMNAIYKLLVHDRLESNINAQL